MCSKNREIVQRGLALRKAKRREEAARMEAARQKEAREAAERENEFALAWLVLEAKAAEENRRRDEREAARREARRVSAQKRAQNLKKHLRHSFGSLALVLGMSLLYDLGAVTFGFALLVMCLCLVYSGVDLLAYTNYRKMREKRKEITAA